jgi:RHS repeat-associated protein
MFNGSSRPRRRMRGALRRVALLVVLALSLSTAMPADAVPAGRDFPLSWLWSWLGTAPAWSAVTGVPHQPVGVLGGKSHYVDASVTDAHQGAGRAPGKGIGALAPYEPPVPHVRQSTTPSRAGEHSFDPKTSVRQAAGATATSDVFKNTDGSYTRHMYENPINFKAADGTWQPIDPTLVRSGSRYQQKANGLDVDLAASADDAALASMRVDASHAVSYALDGAAKAQAKVDGHTATYQDVLPGTDLTLTSTAVGVKEALVLHSADVATSWLFPLDLTGLTPKLETGGSVALVDAAGTVRAHIPHGLMRDSTFDAKSGQFTTSRGVDYALTTAADGRPALKVTIDATWLRDPKRTFPVTVDPTTTFANTGDTYVRNDQPGDHSGEDELLIGTWNSGTSQTYSFMHFTNFEDTYAGAKLSSAYLKIFDSWAYTCTPEPFSVKPINASWSVSTVAFPGPALGSALGSVTADPGVACTNTAGDRSVGTWMSVPLSVATINNWVTNQTTNNGLAVTASLTDSLQWKRFTSRNGPSPSLAPYLSFTYSAGVKPQIDGQYPPAGYNAPTLTPELLVAAHDQDNYPKALTYDYQVFNSSGTKIADSGWISARNWAVPSGKLAWSQDYSWTVTASDGYYQSTSQTVNAFSTPVPQPLITSGLAQNGEQGFEASVGNYTTAATDAVVATVGPPLSIDRSYNSQDPRVANAFGAGWSSIADMRAAEQKDTAGTVQTVVVTYPGGQDIAFGRNANGTFNPPSGRFATFSSVTGGYKLVDKDGTAYVFTNATGTAGVYGVTSIADAQGRTETFTYTSGKLSTITAASGRKLYLTWATPTGATASHVDTVYTDPMTGTDWNTSATWKYQYSGDQLTGACPPTNWAKCTTYTYTTGSQYPTAVMNAGPHSYWRMTETSGSAAVSEVLENQGTDNATYSNVTYSATGPLSGSSAKAIGFNGTTSSVKLPNKLVGTGSYQSLTMWFKANAGDQGPLFSYQASAITSATTTGNYTPSLYVGTSGKLYGKFWDGTSAGPMATSASVADGKWHHVALVGAGDAQWLYVDGVQVGTRTGLITTINSSSATNEYLGAGFIGGNWVDEPHYNTSDSTGYASFFKGSIGEVSFFDRPLAAADVATMAGVGKATAKPLTGVVRPTGNPTVSIAYDATSGKVSQVTDSNGGVWKINKPTVSGSYQAHSAAVLAADPIDYWRLAESGTVDAVNEVNGNTASYNSVTLGVAGGPFDDPAVPSDNTTVASFDGTSSYVALPQDYVPSTAPFSTSLWFKAASGTSGPLFSYQSYPIWDTTSAGQWVPALYIGTSGKLYGEYWSGGVNQIVTTGTVTNNAWHHVVLTASASSQSMYLDGALVGTKSATWTNASSAYPYLGAARMGGSWPDQPHQGASPPVPWYFKGQIAEVSVYGTQLSAAQVTAEYSTKAKAAGLPAKTVTITDPGNKTISHIYDLATGRDLAEIDALGNKTQYGYDVAGFRRTVTDPNGNVTTSEHDVRGNTVSETTCQDRSANQCSTVYFTYYPDATTKTLTPDPRNDVILTQRDGRSASATDNTYLTSFTYDATGNRTQVTDPLGRKSVTLYTDGTTIAAVNGGYAPAGLPYQTTTPGGAVQKIDYFANGDIARVTDPVGKVTEYAYDGLGHVLTSTEYSTGYPSGLVTSYTYDKIGRAVTQTEPAVTNRVTGAVHTPRTTTVYDDDGLALSETVEDLTGGDAARTESNTYNQFGQVLTTTDAAGKVTGFEYDVYGNQKAENDSDGGRVESVFDAEGRMVSETLKGYTGDPNHPSTATDLTTTYNTYDPAGRLASEKDAMGWVTSYTYTDNGLEATVTKQNTATGESFVQLSRAYDAAGNLASETGNNGATTTTFVNDAANRVTSATLDPVTLKRTSTFEYSADDFQVAETVSDATNPVLSKSESLYDALGHDLAHTTYNGAINNTLVPVARWKLNETSGSTAADSAGNSPASGNSGVTWSTAHGGSASFDGSTGRLLTTAPSVDTGRSFTVSAWLNLTDASKTRKALGALGNRQNAFDLRYDDTNRWEFVVKQADVDNASSIAAASTTVPALNTWTHLTGVYDASAGTIKLYVNGALEDTDNTTTFTATGPFRIGSGTWNGSLGNFWQGGIADVQLYQKALSASEVSSVYAGTAPAAGAGVIRTSQVLDYDGNATSVVDPAGNVTNYTYDEAGQQVVTTAPTVNTETNGGTPVATRAVSYTGYDTFGEETEDKDPNGNVTVTAYDAAGRVSSTTGASYTPPGSATPITPVTSNQYDSLGQLTSTTDPLGRVTSYTYDQLGNVAKVVAPDLTASTFTYDANGEQLSATDATGATSSTTYDYLGRTASATQVVRQDNNASYTTVYTYDSHGFLKSARTPSGVTSSQTYNAAGEPVTMTDAAGNSTSTDYDGLGRPTKTTSPDGTYATRTYDLAGRVTDVRLYSSAGVQQTATSTTYDNLGQQTSATDAEGHTTTFGYDPTGLLTSVTEPISASDSITSSFGYDILGNRTRFTDGRGNAFITTYNAWNLPESSIEPATDAYPNAADRTFTTSYDAAGEPVSMTSPGGVSVALTYNSMGRVTRQSGAGAEVATTDRTFGYDDAGRVTSATGSAGTESFSYDDRGGLRSATGAGGDSSFTYNADGEMASRVDAAGTTSYSYDTAGRLATVSNTGAAVSATYGYNTLNQVNKITYGGTGNTRNFGYDALHRLSTDELKTSGGTSIAKVAYEYNKNGDETKKTTTGFSGAATNTYTYDWADRLTSWDNGSAITAYAYDKSGNRTQAGAKTFTYDQRNQLISGLDNGTATAYHYTARGTLASAVSGSNTANTQADAFNEITKQYVDSANASTYTYDGLGRAIRSGFSYSGAGNDLAADGAATYTRGPDGDLMGVATALSKTLTWTDQHDDVVGEFTATGTALSGSVGYDPLGKVLSSANMLGHLGYQSEYTDNLTGRVNMLARWYNPDTGQFDTRDTVSNSPVPDSIDANRFQYGSANPLTTTDPTGHWSLGGLWNAAKQKAASAYHAVTSFVSSTYNSARSDLNELRMMARERIASARRYVAQKVSQVKHAVKAVVHKAVHIYHAARNYVAQKYHAAKTWVKKKVAQGRKWVAHQYHKAKEAVKKAWHKVKQAGKAVVAKATKVVHKAVHLVKDAYKDPIKFIKEHKKQLIEAAAIVGGIAAGLACTAATAGAGAVACMVGASALINVAKDAAEGNIHSVSDALGSLGTGAVQGLAGIAGGAIGGKIAGAVVCKMGSAAVSLGGKMLAGGVAGGVGDAATQLLSTGHVDLTQVAISAGIGAITGGRAKCGGKHSFDPQTRVVMADGSTRPIKDVNVGDKVKATDPKTGRTQAKTVTMLHRNRDKDLVDVKVRTARGRTTTLHTTEHHPFWDGTARKWVDAAKLKAGHKLRNVAGAALVTVLAVTGVHGAKVMDDLTVADTHTYYVVAVDQPVLVHNVDPAHCGLPSPEDAGIPRHSKRKTAATSDGGASHTLSGWSPRMPKAFSRVSTAAVAKLRAGFGLSPRTSGNDQGVPGRYYDSHAEPQAYAKNPDGDIVVDRDPCGSCQEFLTGAAVRDQRSISVSHPSGVTVFHPTGDMEFAPRSK